MQQCSLTINDIPLEILTAIAVSNYGYAYHEMLSVPLFARFTLGEDNQQYLQRLMVKREILTELELYNRHGRPYSLVPCEARRNNSVVTCYLMDKLHSVNDKFGNIQPAVVLANGTQYWYQNGELHRDGEPAVICYNGAQCWYQNGELHRDNDQPAIIYVDGTRRWYQNGERHRDNDQPAVMHANGTQRWYQNNKLHRDNDQPAVVLANGTQCWYQNGVNMPK